MSDNVIEHDVVESPEKRLVASLPKDGVRSLFHLLAGKPDSVQKPYFREVVVSVDSILELHDQIKDKLKNHHLESLVASVDVTYEDNTTAQFGSWQEFSEHKWVGPEATSEVVARWDFLVSMPDFEIPQRHTLVVTITSDVKPFHILRTVLSSNPDDLENLELEMTPVIARVDFINHILSKELISIVDSWNDALPQPDKERKLYKFIEGNSQKIESSIKNIFPFLSFLIAYISLDWAFPNEIGSSPVTIDVIKTAFTWGLIVSASLLFVIRFSGWLSNIASRGISKHGSYSIFRITNGDKNKQSELDKKNRKHATTFFISGLTSLVLNVVAGVIVVKYFSGL